MHPLTTENAVTRLICLSIS